jgi:uncharacterized protein
MLRRHFCEQEVRLNTRLAPQVYLRVASVLLFADHRIRFGPIFSPGVVPLPGTIRDGGYVVDYTVVMVRLPDETTLESRVRTGTATPTLLAEIARYVAAFHATSHTDEHIASFGGLEVIRGNWEENFEQMRPYIGRTLDATTYAVSSGISVAFWKSALPSSPAVYVMGAFATVMATCGCSTSISWTRRMILLTDWPFSTA